jgi:hypothetical protein
MKENGMSKEMPAVIIVTRFSVYWKEVLPTKEWINSRFELLKRTALPSLQQQTRQNFVWVLKTAPEYYNYVADLFKSVSIPNSAIKIVSESPKGEARIEDVQDIHPGAERFITLRLDSDDALSSKAIERIAAASADETDNEVLFNLPSGIQLDWDTGDMFYLTFRPHRQGPFLALMNTSRDSMLFAGGNKGGHLTVRSAVEKVVDIGGLNWLQVVHGTNISNTMRYKKLRYKPPVAKLFSAAALLWPRLKIADIHRVPAHLQESILAEFGVCWEDSKSEYMRLAK